MWCCPSVYCNNAKHMKKVIICIPIIHHLYKDNLWTCLTNYLNHKVLKLCIVIIVRESYRHKKIFSFSRFILGFTPFPWMLQPVIKPGFAEQQAAKNAMGVYCILYGIHSIKLCLYFIHKHSGLSKLYVLQSWWLTKNYFLLKQQYWFAAGSGLSCSMILSVVYQGNKASHCQHRLLSWRVYFCLFCFAFEVNEDSSTDEIQQERCCYHKNTYSLHNLHKLHLH